jgi:hypothetical protein
MMQLDNEKHGCQQQKGPALTQAQSIKKTARV